MATDDLIVTFTIQPIQSIQISPRTVNFALLYGGHGRGLYEPRTININYNITATGAPQRITARLNERMPDNTVLSILADPPRNATRAGWVDLTMSEQTIVSNVRDVHQSHLLMYLRMTADVGAPIGTHTRRITFTLQD